MIAYERHERRGTGADLQADDVWAEALEILDLAEYCDEQHSGRGTGLDLDTRQIVKQAASILRRRKLPWERNAVGGAAPSQGASEATERPDGSGGHGEGHP